MLKDFQSGIVCILGFIGVIITLWVNAHLAQVARDEQIRDLRASRYKRLSIRNCCQFSRN